MGPRTGQTVHPQDSVENLKLFSPKSVPIRRYIKVRMYANPYIDTEYFKEGEGKAPWHDIEVSPTTNATRRAG